MDTVKNGARQVNNMLEKPFLYVLKKSSSSALKALLLVVIIIAVISYLVLLYVWMTGSENAGYKLLTFPTYLTFLGKNLTKSWPKDASGAYNMPTYNTYMRETASFFVKSGGASSSFFSRFDPSTQSHASLALSAGQRDNVGVGEHQSSSCGYNAEDAAVGESVHGRQTSQFHSGFSEAMLMRNRNTV
jgi:hypothetical protein